MEPITTMLLITASAGLLFYRTQWIAKEMLRMIAYDHTPANHMRNLLISVVLVWNWDLDSLIDVDPERSPYHKVL